MSRESNKAIIFSLCVVLFAGCKSEQSETPTSTPQPSANSAPIVAINNAPVTGPPTQPAQPAGTSPSLPLGVPPPRPSGLPSPQDVVPVKPTAQPGARSAQDPVEVTNVESQFGIGTLQGWQVLGELTNASGKRLQKVALTMSLLDDNGKSLSEITNDVPPALTPREPGESKRFTIPVNPPAGWKGKAIIKATHVEF